MKKHLIITLLTMLTMHYAAAQNLDFSTKYMAGNNGIANEEYSFYFANGWLIKTDLSNNRSDKYPSYNDDSFYDKDGNYSMFFTPNQYANIDAVDFLSKCQNDTRAYRVVFDRNGGKVLYVKELRKRYNTETEKYYISEFGKKLF